MRRIGIAVLTMIVLGAGVALAQEKPPFPAGPKPMTPPKGEVGRYVFFQARSAGELEYLLDSVTGDLWVISRDPDTNYVYLGFIPKGPSFTFEDILRQRQIKRVPTEP